MVNIFISSLRNISKVFLELMLKIKYVQFHELWVSNTDEKKSQGSPKNINVYKKKYPLKMYKNDEVPENLYLCLYFFHRWIYCMFIFFRF